MSRSERLLDLLQALRRHRRPVTGAALAAQMGISLRTLYRDIASLQAQGARIEGEPGVGYVLRPGFLLPPLMFSVEEIEALALGTLWVAERADGPLGLAARNALAKVAAVLPPHLRDDLETSALLVAPGAPIPPDRVEVARIREAIRTERKTVIGYRDQSGQASTRAIWPFGLAYFDHVRVVIAWCELRQDFRSFRTDRIDELTLTAERYPKRRRALLKAWREQQQVPAAQRRATDGN